MINQKQYDLIRWEYRERSFSITDEEASKIAKLDWNLDAWELKIILDVDDYVQAMQLIQGEKIIQKLDKLEMLVSLNK